MKSLKILLVEDETITAMDLRETLEEAGHKVTAIARNFEQAIRAAKSNPPDLALIDIHLEEGSTENGITTARELIAEHRMPIIYLTANSDVETFQLAKETLPAAYLLKPFRHDELKLQVELAYYYFHYNQKNTSGASMSGTLYLPVDKGHEKIDMNDVLYLQADGSYVKVFMIQKELPHHISTNLSHLAQYFSAPNFYRLSRSLLINLNHLERLERNHLFLINHKTPIQIPSTSRKELMKKLTIVRTK
ncbi:response regulator [Spirosoma radiotolerans]|uniref:Two component transcriptional regulator, LytTR family protein n=1 Tax=Spirosoma radiotolerans TaxID=1379870 RepID=A0A0E3ZU06_9BACT|nr:response regulator [Spirosoma radiotolerans]AKD54309.1 two component transcriptional regulator, LytTR family protein [Spirosoma radiotolerans]